jgi:hypothetical protein
MKCTAILAPMALLTIAAMAMSDEGMWVYNKLPLKTLKEKYDFTPTEAWADHLRMASVRFNSGGSGSFISPNGLVMTNHHVGADVLQKISTEAKDYYRDGFSAKTHADEIKAPDLELNVLMAIKDVTSEVNAAVKEGMSDAEAGKARRQAMAAIEKKATAENGLRNDVVTLYQGGQYHLYTFKRYTDVRLVFAPEFDIAFFGGDPDNFEYPRYDLDVCFFRAYENDKPAKVEHYLNWSANGAKDGELIFVSGHPGRTSRLNTHAHLSYLRDESFPALLDWLKDKEKFLLAYSERGPEQARQAKEYLFGIQNSRKARIGGYEGLMNKEFMASKKAAEEKLRARLASGPKSADVYTAAYEAIAGSQKASSEIRDRFTFLEQGRAFDTDLFGIARTLVRLAEEEGKPDGERLREYQESGRPSLELALFSDAPIFPEFEKARLAHSLGYWKKHLANCPAGNEQGMKDLLEKILDGRTPEEAAKALIDGSKLADVATRKAMAKGGSQAIAESKDPMIALVKLIDAPAREVRKMREDRVEAVETAAYATIAKGNFEAYGDSVYPDATFTLRLAFGTIKGYEIDGKTVPPFTTFAGAFEHEKAHGAEPPYKLPPSWHKAKAEGRMDLSTPLNNVSTADIIGGNSGSPVVNRDGEVVGLIFDGNIQSLVLDFGYEDRIARAVSVDSRGILGALKTIYQADGLVKEITGGK